MLGALAVLGDLCEVAGQHSDDLVDFGARLLAERCHSGCRCLLQFVQQLDREPREIIDEVERVLDLVGNAGGQLAECRHLLGMQEAGLCRLQLAQCPLGGVARRPDLFFGALPLGDIGVDHDKAAARHRVAPHLDDTTVGSRVLEAQFPAELLEAAAQLRFDVVAAVFAAPGEKPYVVGIRKTFRQEGLGQIEDPLKIQVPCGKPQLRVEHCDPVAHIVERDTQLGLALADLVQ